MTPEQWTGVLAVLGSSAVLAKALDGIRAWRSGRASAERERNREQLAKVTGLESALAECRRVCDAEATHRRLIAEHAHHLRALLLDAGWSPTDLPPWPDNPHR